MPRKLYTIWWLVLLGGLTEGLLALPLLAEPLQEPAWLTLYVPAVILAGGVLTGIMFMWLRGHPFRGVLRLLAVASVGLGLYLLAAHPSTVGMLLVLVGVWMGIRGFAALWLGLSIVNHPYIRIVTVLAGLSSLAFGAVAMLWLSPITRVIVPFLAAYGVGAVALHIVVALRMRADKKRFLMEQPT